MRVLMPTPTGSVRWAALVALVALLSGRVAVAEDDPQICADITDREAFQRALLWGCDTITLGGELPAMTRAIPIEQTVTIDAGAWSIPPLEVGGPDEAFNQTVYVTIQNGRAEAHRAVKNSEPELPRIIDLQPGIQLTLKDTTIEAGTVSGAGGGPSMHTIVRQRATTGDGTVEILGARTETVLDHILLLQQSIMSDGESCVLEADARLGPSSSGPTALTLVDDGVVVAALCTINGAVQDSFGTASARALVLDRVWLDGDASGMDMDMGSENFTFSPIDTPAAVILRESLWTFDAVTRSVVSSESTVTLSAVLAGDVERVDASLVHGTRVSIDQSIFCGLAEGGALASGTVDSASLTVHRSALYGMKIPLLDSTESTTLTLESVTLTGSAELVGGDVVPSISNTYIEGSWDLPALEGGSVSALRMVGTDCPGDSLDCVELPGSLVQAGTEDCSEVLSAYFLQNTALADWPEAMLELDRLVETGEGGDDLVGVSTDTNAGWGCEQQPPRIGAWPGEGCGLPMLAYALPVAEGGDTADGTARPDVGDSGQQPGASAARNVYGCQGRNAGAAAVICFLLPGLFARARRRRWPTAPPET
jgi:hypothetical protein